MPTSEQDSSGSRVPPVGTHDAEIEQRRERWGWVEPAIWTDRHPCAGTRTALETGVKGGRWFSLMDTVSAERTLVVAWDRVKRNRGAAGVDRQSVTAFEAHAERYLGECAEALRNGTYRPQPVRRVWIDKPGRSEQRPLGIPTFAAFCGSAKGKKDEAEDATISAGPMPTSTPTGCSP